jgi:putative transposase
MDLNAAFQSFFSGGGYPRFRKRDDFKFRFPQPKTCPISDDWIKFPKMGWGRFRKSREIEGEIRSASVKYRYGHWWVSILAKSEVETPAVPFGDAIGIDRGITNSFAYSTGLLESLPVATKKELNRAKFLARAVSRKVRGSNRGRKAKARLARLKRRVADRRRDATHCVVNRLVRSHPVICVEKLKLRNMSRSAKGTKEEPGRNVRAKSGLNRTLLEQGHGEFVQVLKYKAESVGVVVVEVPPAYTSQQCSCCGYVAPENRIETRFRCVSCGHEAHADVNAALNIRAAGLAVLVQGGSALAARRTANPQKIARRIAA